MKVRRNTEYTHRSVCDEKETSVTVKLREVLGMKMSLNIWGQEEDSIDRVEMCQM